jgi:hypothetical protein
MADTALNSLGAIITRLKAVTAVTDIVSTRIYTQVPQQADFPYIVITMDSDDWSTKDFSDMEHKVRVHGFSRYDGMKECLDIRSAVIDALDRQEANVPVTGATTVLLQKDSLSTSFQEPDGKTWQSVVQFNMIVQSN